MTRDSPAPMSNRSPAWQPPRSVGGAATNTE
jgi:hypothetical protein